MQPEEHEVYTRPYQPVSTASVGILEPPPIKDTSSEQGTGEPPGSPYGPPYSQPMRPRKRRRAVPAGAIVLLAFIFGTGLFSGWEFAHASTTTTAVTTSTATSSSSTSLQAQQEAAIAKIEPSVVEIIVTTAEREQIRSGVFIDAQGDIVTNNHVVSGAQSINEPLRKCISCNSDPNTPDKGTSSQ